MAASASWLAETTRTYFGNAASRRDFRVQMRGSKPFWVFTFYVLSLCLIGLTVYWQTLGREGISIAGAQSELTGFFTSLIAILAAAICVISPGLTGTAIVAERQRLSLDLVLCAPVTPKYLLVGKMIGSYRYIWMLLILALPVVAMSVVLGGATWTDVFGCFLLLSFHALVFTSLALLVSSVTTKPASAVIWSFFAVAGYVIASSVLAASAYASSFMGGGKHLPFTVAFSPFTPIQALNSTTVIGTHEVPNWIFGGVFAFLVTRLFLLGAAVNLAPLDRRLSANLRITGLVYTFLLSFLIMYGVGGATKSAPPGDTHQDMIFTVVALGAVGWLLVGAPMFSCYGGDGSRRHFFNGRFSLRHIFDGTPAGNLPYVLLLIAMSYAGVIVGAGIVSPGGLGDNFAQALLWPVGFVVFCWSVGQFMSEVTKSLKAARALTLCLLLAPSLLFSIVMSVCGLTPPWLIDPNADMARATTGLWYLWPFAPLTSYHMFEFAWVYGVVMLGAGLVLTIWTHSVRSRRQLRVSNA